MNENVIFILSFLILELLLFSLLHKIYNKLCLLFLMMKNAFKTFFLIFLKWFNEFKFII